MNTTLKKALKIIKKIFLTLLALFIISCMVVGIIFGIIEYQERHDHYTSRRLSDDVAVHCFYMNSHKFGIYNEVSEKYSIKGLDWVTEVNPADSFSVFSRNDKRGYVNIHDGSVIIPEQYEKAWVFSDGLAAAMKDGKIGFINSRNETVLPFEFDYAEGVSYLFCDGYCTMSDSRRACGLIDRNGDWVLEPQFDCIWAPDDNHLRLVSDNGKFGLMNTSFTFDFPIIYDWIITLDDGNYYMIKDGIKKKVLPEGGVIQDFVVDHTWALKYPVGVESYVGEDRWGDPDRKEEVSNALSDYLGYRIDYGENYTFGVIHAKTGQVIVPALYDQIEMVSDKLFKAEDLNDRTYVLIDLEGRIIQERRK
ncbi:MAG: WG repeat-containing protein [Bacteroidales bacterium]|nr:WG repeat-containing protein [Bacteroidales bacterium]